MPPARLKLAVLISGRGSNLRALIAACADPGFPAEIGLVLSNRADAKGLEAAAAAGIATAVIDHKGFADRAAFDAAIHARLEAAGVGLICLAGFMRLFTPDFVARWQGRIVNIHPSLLPAFKGLHVHEQALQAGVRLTGCTVHFVSAEVDAGPIIVQAAVPVLAGDDPERLAARVLEAEHRCYPLAVRLIAEGRVRIEGDRTVVESPGKDSPGADAAGLRDFLLNPAA
jgi:phosphoribosylglycinamide formyltransferase-1